MLKLFAFTPLLVFIVSCGIKEDSSSSYKISYVNSSEGEPILLEKASEDFTCPSLLTNKQDQDVVSQFHSNWRYIVIPFKIPTKFRSGVVKSSILNKVEYGGELSYYESLVKGKFVVQQTISSQEFKACPGYDYSQEETYEAATTSALYPFKEVENLQHIKNLNLPMVKLKVAPLVQHTQEYKSGSKIVKEKRTLVNNAFYHHEKNEIVFLPQGKNKSGNIPFSKVPLWKIPFVGAHEYGHHLFSHLLKNYFKEKKVFGHNRLSLCFNTNHQHGVHIHKASKQQENVARKVTVHDVMDSLNEGIADLFARTILERKFNLSGIGCFEYTRDVENERLANWDVKKLDENVFETFLSSKRVETSNCYKEQDYQDPHIIGAIVAHGLYKLFELGNFSKEERVESLILWLKSMDRSYYTNRNLGVKQFMEKNLSTAIRMIRDRKSIPQDKVCDVISKHFPTIKAEYNCI